MKLIPGKNSALDSGYQSGDLVMYENDGTALLAMVLAFKKQKYAILNERGREVELPAIRLFTLPGKANEKLDTTRDKQTYLESLRKRAEAKAKDVDLGDLWDSVQSDSKEYSNHELAELYYGKIELETFLALRFALLSDKTFFKRLKDGFEPRHQEVVEQLKAAERARLEKERKKEILLSALKQRLKDKNAPIPHECREHLELLSKVAAASSHLDQNDLKEAKEFVDLCADTLHLPLGGGREQRAYQLLEAVGHFGPTTNLALIRHDIPERFPERIVAAAKRLEIPEFTASQKGSRVDLTALHCITIDDDSTRDMDDAISLEETDSGYRLGIHISDVASMIAPGSELEHEAKLRTTSLYLPEGIIPMLPEEISENKASLVCGEIRPTLSCLCEIDRSYQLKRWEIVPSFIKVSERFSYNSVDAYLEGDHRLLHHLYQIAVTHEEQRNEKGAMKVYKRDLMIVLDQHYYPQLIEFDEHGPARGLVGEMMVIANMIFASYGVEHSLPLTYRLQDAPESQDSPTAPDGPAADYQRRAQLKKSSVSLAPGRHAGLGLDAYIQATSPIRRYIDLCNQRQILHHLETGKHFYSEENFDQLLQETSEALNAAQATTKETKRYWLLRYLELRSHKKIPAQGVPDQIHGTVLRTDLKNPLVELEEVFLPVLARIDRKVQAGDQVTLKIVSIDPRSDYVRLEAI